MIIHLTRISPNARRTFIRRNATIPEDFIGPAALPLFCLAPHGVFRASRIAPRAVSSYLAFSPLPALFSKNRRYVFCDTFRQHALSRMLPAYFTRHAAVRCSDFPPANPANAELTSDHLPSERSISQSGKQESRQRVADAAVAVTQNGEGTAIRKMVIIASAMMSLASMAPMFPSKLPHPARPASIMRLPAMTSPMIAPITGPTN